MSDLTKELDIGCAIARQAGEIAMRYYRTGIRADSKPDDSPVTRADRECEQAIAQALEEAFPDDGLLGEEGAEKPSRSGRRWIIDPIDGTRDFVRGNPAWANLIGLEADGEVVAGFANMPALGELFWAVRGGGAFVNGERIHASGIDSVGQAVLCIDALNSAARQPFGSRLVSWIEPFWAVRSMGGCMDALMVARGQAEIWIETNGKAWDFAPLKIIAEEAGARYFDFTRQSTIYGGNCVIYAPGLEETVWSFLNNG
ncbi:MAG TPA: inositol monophosphatase family protein [Bryobacteraceae bacterium]|nr:inositol monophosphatase family protein [Bryobacteraceae bacterium]